MIRKKQTDLFSIVQRLRKVESSYKSRIKTSSFLSFVELERIRRDNSFDIHAPRKHEKVWQEAKKKYKESVDKPESEWIDKDWATVTVIMQNILESGR